VLQPSGFDGLGFDLLSHFQYLRTAAVIDVGGRQVSEALVVSMIIVVFDESAYPPS
jgi:endonuclease YncB( thermonuclease family)